VALSRLHEAAQHALNEVLDMRGRGNLDAASAAGDKLTAAQVASGLREMGAGCTEDEFFTAESLSVAQSMHRSFEQLADNLVSLNLLTKEQGRLSNHA
jgi:hypothetical protein